MGITLNPFTGNFDFTGDTQSIVWPIFIDMNNVDDAGGGASELFEFNIKSFSFAQGLNQVIRALFKVPYDFTGGQLKLRLSCYSGSLSNNFLFSCVSTLIRSEVDSINSSTNSYSSTNTFLTNDAVQYKNRLIDFDLTNSSGLINSVQVSANDLISIAISRSTIASDDTDLIRVIPYAQLYRV